MKSYVYLFVIGITFSLPAISSDSISPDHWNYVEASRLVLKSDDNSQDEEGYGLGAKYALDDIFYLSGMYQVYDIGASDVDRYILGIGGRYNINNQLIPYAQLDRVKIKVKSKFGNADVDYWIISAGISGTLRNFGYKLALTQYEAISENLGSGSESGYYVEAYYSINKTISLGVEIESINDTGDFYNYGFRYHF